MFLQVKNRLSIRTLGRMVALGFGLTLFLQVACLPWISAYATQVEKTILAEVDELGNDESDKTIQQFQMFAPLVFPVQYSIWKPDIFPSNLERPTLLIPPKSSPFFITNRSLLI